MKRELKIISFCDLVFLLALSLSGSFKGILSIVIYILGAIGPLMLVHAMSDEGGLKDGVRLLRIKPARALGVLPTVAPTLLSVYLLSLLTAFLMGELFGVTAEVNLGDNLALALLKEALLVPAVEEAVFRFIPLLLIGKRSPRLCVLSSALLFAFCHCSFFSLPYAFVAGVIFMLIDLASDSVLPSLVIHILNNLFSVIMIFGGSAEAYLIAVSLLTVLSVAIMIIFRKKYLSAIKEALVAGEKYSFSYEPLLVLFLTAFIAVTNLL